MSALVRWGLPSAVVALLVPVGMAGWMVLTPPERSVGGGGPDRGSHFDLAAPASLQEPLIGAAERAAPFRPDGRPSRVAYDPARTGAPEAAPPKPALVVSGLVDGTVPLVVLEGVPGRDGPVLLGVGDTVAGLRIRRIKEGSVTITGMDTTWVLTIRGLQ